MAKDHSTGKSCPARIPTEKRLTVGKLYYYYTPREDAPPGTTNCPVKVPWIQLRGRWLNEVGFGVGKMVRVRVRPGRLVLTVEKS